MLKSWYTIINNHPLNLGVLFLLELAAVVSFSTWCWRFGNTVKYLLAIGLHLIAMAVWAVFRVPGDPGNAPVAVSGIVRLLIEVLFFSAAIITLFQMDYRVLAWVFILVTVVHNAVSYDRILHLINAYVS